MDLRLDERMTGSSKSSYQKIGDCRLIIRHSKRVDDNKIGARGRNINKIFIETKDGERLMFPNCDVHSARAMARHFSNGGYMDDDIGSYIKKLSDEANNLAVVARHISHNQHRMDDEGLRLRGKIRGKLHEYKNTLGRLSGTRGYDLQIGNLQEQSGQGDDDFDEETLNGEVEKLAQKLGVEKDEKLKEALGSAAKVTLKEQSNQQEELDNAVEQGDLQSALGAVNVKMDTSDLSDEEQDMLLKFLSAYGVFTGEKNTGKELKNIAQQLASGNVDMFPKTDDEEDEPAKFTDKYTKLGWRLGKIAPRIKSDLLSNLASRVSYKLSHRGQSGVDPVTRPEAQIVNSVLKGVNEAKDMDSSPLNEVAKLEQWFENYDPVQIFEKKEKTEMRENVENFLSWLEETDTAELTEQEVWDTTGKLVTNKNNPRRMKKIVNNLSETDRSRVMETLNETWVPSIVKSVKEALGDEYDPNYDPDYDLPPQEEVDMGEVPAEEEPGAVQTDDPDFDEDLSFDDDLMGDFDDSDEGELEQDWDANQDDQFVESSHEEGEDEMEESDESEEHDEAYESAQNSAQYLMKKYAGLLDESQVDETHDEPCEVCGENPCVCEEEENNLNEDTSNAGSMRTLLETLNQSEETQQKKSLNENKKTAPKKRVDEKTPPGQEDFVEDPEVKQRFKDQYGDRWEEVLYATAWDRHKKGIGEDANAKSRAVASNQEVEESSAKANDILNVWNKMNAFESGDTQLNEGTWALPFSEEDAQELERVMQNPIPVGEAPDVVGGLLGSDSLYDKIADMEEEQGPDADARPLIANELADHIADYREDPEDFKDEASDEVLDKLQMIANKYSQLNERGDDCGPDDESEEDDEGMVNRDYFDDFYNDIKHPQDDRIRRGGSFVDDETGSSSPVGSTEVGPHRYFREEDAADDLLEDAEEDGNEDNFMTDDDGDLAQKREYFGNPDEKDTNNDDGESPMFPYSVKDFVDHGDGPEDK